jgi:sugar lactone lactonase YvrE
MRNIRFFICLFLLATPTSAQTFQHGDVVFGWFVPSILTDFQPNFIDWYAADGTLRRQITSSTSPGAMPEALIFGADSRLYATQPFLGIGGGVIVYDTAGNRVSGRFGPQISATTGIARDRQGNLFVSGDKLYKLDPSGNLVASFNAPLGDIDLAPDQCTMLIVSLDRSIRRYDVCRNMPLPDLTTNLPGVQAFDLRILPDQSILVAIGNAVARVAPDGSFIRTYTLPSVGSAAVALATDGNSFWTGATDRGVFRVRLSDGAILAGPLPASQVWSIAVVDEPRAAIVGPAAIPAISPIALAMLAFALSLTALARLR